MSRRALAAVATGALLVASACSSDRPSTGTPAWRSLPDGVLGTGTARVVDATVDGPAGTIAVGSVTADGKQGPAAWRTVDGLSWEALHLIPKTVYGFQSELTTVAAEPDGRASAIGQAVGGTHGNPRIGSWYLDGTTLVEVPAGVELYGGPRQGSVNEMAAGPAGFAVVGTRTDHGNERTGAAVWTSPDAHDAYTILDTDPALESAPGETVRAVGAAGSPAGYLAVGDRSVDGRTDGDAVIWTSTTGRQWARVPDSAAPLGGAGDQSLQLATAWGAGWAAAGVETIDGETSVAVWATRDGSQWFRTRVDAVGTSPDPLSQVTSLATVGSTLVVAARLGNRFVAASSRDGVTWSRIPLPVGSTDDPHAVAVLMPVGDRLVVALTTTEGTRLWSTDLSQVT